MSEMSQSGYQSPETKIFYEGAWQLRADFLQKLIDAGEKNPFRLTQLLMAHERKYKFNPELTSKPLELVSDIYIKNDYGGEVGPAGVPVLRQSSFRGQYIDVPFYAEADLNKYVIDFYEQRGPFDALVELGCGLGHKLFEIYHQGGPKIPYYGGEFTQSGVAIANKLAKLNSDHTYSFHHFDHLNPDLSWLPKYDRVLVYTMHTIEQVREITPQWFDVVGKCAKKVVCLNFEPFGYQLQELGPATKGHKDLFQKMEWNQNFGPTLLAAQKQGLIRIEYLETELFLPTDQDNATSLAIWHSPA